MNVFLSGCLFLCPALNRDFSQVYNAHRSFARLTAPYPSAFICREGAGFGFVFFSCHLGSNSQEFLHLHLARV